REGYSYLFNTDMKRELEHLGMFFKMARDYGRSRGFKGVFMIEPKPMEPSTHQYDFDAATVIGFLERFGLQNDFKLNIESNHATLAGHSFAHELQTASDSGLLGSLDINRGISQNGWDTDNFPTDIYDAVQAMIVILSQGGIAPGCLNFDAKLRRNSTDPEDIFIAHIAGMDTYARGLEIAYNILNETEFKDLKRKRYSSYDSGKGLDFEKGSLKLEDLANIARENKEPALISGKQEYLESIINKYI
ncbi:MAG: xylose isomerase, partial [Ignavibacteriae bacterium]|nr:xylose isomerase [Ignavibacteriota bacterium]